VGKPSDALSKMYGFQPTKGLTGGEEIKGIFNVDRLWQVLGIGGRAVQAAEAGAIQQAKEAGLSTSGPTQIEQGAVDTPATKATDFMADAATMLRGGPIAGPIYYAAKKGLEHLLSPKQRIGGIDPKEFVDKLGTEQLPVKDVATRVWENVKTSVDTTAPGVGTDLDAVLQGAAREYQRVSVRQAAAEHSLTDGVRKELEAAIKNGRIPKNPDAIRDIGARMLYDAVKDDPAASERADELMLEHFTRDPSAKHPELTRLAHEVFFDPFMYFNPGKALAKVPGISHALNAAKAVGLKGTKLLRSGTAFDPWRVAKGDTAKAMVEGVELAADRGAVAKAEAFQLAREEVELVKAMPKKYRKLAYEVLTEQKPLESLPEKYRNVPEILDRFNKTLRGVGEEAGTLNTIKGGQVVLEPEIPGRVPFRVQEDPTLPDTVLDKTRRSLGLTEKPALEIETLGADVGRETLEAGAAKARVENDPTRWVADLGVQMDAELHEVQRKVKVATEVKEVTKALEDVTESSLTLPGKVMVETKKGTQWMTSKQLGRRGEKLKKGIETRTEALLNLRESSGGWIMSEADIAKSKKLRATVDEMRVAQKVNDKNIQIAKEFEKNISGKLQELKAKTGVEWVSVAGDADLGRIYTRITGVPFSTEVGQNVHLMPRAAMKHFRTLLPVLGDIPGGSKDWIDTVSKVLDKTMVPINAVFRRSVTTPYLSYMVRNLQGAVAMGLTAQKLRFANPKMLYNTAKMAVYSGGLNSSKALKSKVLVGADKVELGQILKWAKEDGVIDQFDFLVKGDTAASKALDRVLSFNIPGTGQTPGAVRKALMSVSPKRVNKTVEDFQHLLGYVGFLHGTDRAARAKAVKQMTDFFGNYRRMSDFERSVLSEVVPFYGWMRFVAPYTLRRVVDSHDVLALTKKLYEHNERQWGQYFDRKDLPPASKNTLWTLPLKYQSKAIQRMVKDGVFPQPGSHQWAMTNIETPLMGFSTLRSIEAIFGDPTKRSTREQFAMHIGLYIKTILDIITHRDTMTGNDIVSILPEFEGVTSYKEAKQVFDASGIGSFSRNFTERGRRTWNTLVSTFTDGDNPNPGTFLDLRARYAAANALAGLDVAANYLAGNKPTEKHLLLQAPGSSTVWFNPERSRAKNLTDARLRLNDRTWGLMHTDYFKWANPKLMFGE